MTTLILHHCVSARSFRPLWLLEELGAPYQLLMLPFPPRAVAKSFLNDNPLGTVPLLEDGAVRMTESAAICQYLAARHGDGALDVAPADPAYGAYLNALHQGEATLTFPQTLVLRYRHFEPPEQRLPAVADGYARWFLARLRWLENGLQQQPDFACANRFTAADVSLGYALMVGDYLGLAPQFPQAVGRYWAGLQQRPAYQRALQTQYQAAVDQGVPTTPTPLLRPFD
ncbi:MAG: glutathione S-transferase [Pseudomonadota bacterium]